MAVSGFNTRLDVLNAALQRLGAGMISSEADGSKNASEVVAAYDQCRRAELARNVWAFATRKTMIRALAQDDMRIQPAKWDAAIGYPTGSIVALNDVWYICMAGVVGTSPEAADHDNPWEAYYGPVTASRYDADTTYSSGEIVYVPTSKPGKAQVFLSLTSGNTQGPMASVVFDPTVEYARGSVVIYGGFYYISLIDFNTGNQPDQSPAPWNSKSVYGAGDKVGGSDGSIYVSITGSNVGNQPVADTSGHWVQSVDLCAWSPSFATDVGAEAWLSLAVTLRPVVFVYPVGAGPRSDQSSRNVFMLPAGYLRQAPQDPKNGAVSYLGAPSWNIVKDWVFEDNHFTSSEPGPILFRFVADIVNVRQFNPMFAVGLACRVAEQVCEALTQSGAKVQTIQRQYDVFMGEARTLNGIETGPTEPPEDDWVACRI